MGVFMLMGSPLFTGSFLLWGLYMRSRAWCSDSFHIAFFTTFLQHNQHRPSLITQFAVFVFWEQVPNCLLSVLLIEVNFRNREFFINKRTSFVLSHDKHQAHFPIWENVLLGMFGQIGVQPSVYVLDTPGILVPNINNVETGLKLALTGTILFSSTPTWVFWIVIQFNHVWIWPDHTLFCLRSLMMC